MLPEDQSRSEKSTVHSTACKLRLLSSFLTYINFNSYSSRTHRIWSDIYNQRVLISDKSDKNICFSKLSTILLISSGETSSDCDIFFTDDAAKKNFSDLQNFSTRNSPSVFPYLVKLNDNGSYHGLREPIRKLENHYPELNIY